jgi:adenosylcobinamide-GDP ribazoletransferase
MLIAAGIAIVGAVGIIGSMAIGAIVAVGVVAVGCGSIAKAKIGGQTGDILGAVQQMTEISVMMFLVASLAG